MKLLPAVLLVILVPAALAETPAAPPPAAPAAPAAAGVPLNKWLIVRESTGKGLKKGGGIRFRADGFDTAEGGLGSTNPTTCTADGAKLTCEGGIAATLVKPDEVRVELGKMTFKLAPATDKQAAEFAQWVSDAQAQRTACGAAADCCIAAEGPLGQPCDLNKALGDRKLATCTAALASTRAALTAKNLPLPEKCR